ncbi:MAG: hypothetical protein K9W44_03895 [Candidatus Lokiarchaeota archaeon]|nr:hypothetical protein [Candidatus Harpocratesius repetitus]
MRIKNNDKNQNQKRIKRLPGNSWVIGNLPYGCQLCMKGMKVVYFMGGDCNLPNHCRWYCPISEHRKSSLSHFVDEISINNPDDIKNILSTLEEEISAVDAKGMSFTGGDPLSSSRKKDLVCAIIQEMKLKYGKNFHIHLYTSGVTFDPIIANRLDKAGLDSIRFHPALEDFSKIEFALGHSYSVGAEVPVIPTEENHQYILKLIQYLQAIGANYINLNEFEMCAPNQEELIKRGFHLQQGTLATVEGSRKFAERVVEDFSNNENFTVHFCSVAVKDQVQIRERYLRRADNIHLPFEEISEDGCLLFMQIQGPLSEILKLEKFLLKQAKIPEKMMKLNKTRGTLDLPPFLANEKNFLEILEDFRVKCGIYEILPFRDPKLAEVREYTPIFNNLPSHLHNK